jgi:hypothetical protein
MDAQHLNPLLTTYSLPSSGVIAAKRRQLKLYIGLPDL